jgi:phosphoribosylamine--glycine ligase
MSVKVLVVGGGGREHAIVKALVRSDTQICAAMRNKNPGIARSAVSFSLVKETDIDKVLTMALEESVELAVVGP